MKFTTAIATILVSAAVAEPSLMDQVVEAAELWETGHNRRRGLFPSRRRRRRRRKPTPSPSPSPSGGGACNVACNKVTKALTCTAGCKGVDEGICKTAEYVACKAGCLGIHSCKKKCEKKIVKPCVKKIVDDCDKKCVENIIKPCQAGCDKDGYKVCDKVVAKVGVKIGTKVVGTEVCAELCSEAAVLADAAGAGPEDPFADAVAAAIEIGCIPACKAAFAKALQPSAKSFADSVCEELGFKGSTVVV